MGIIAGVSGVGVCGGGAVADVADAGAGVGAVAKGSEAETGTAATCSGAGMGTSIFLFFRTF